MALVEGQSSSTGSVGGLGSVESRAAPSRSPGAEQRPESREVLEGRFTRWARCARSSVWAPILARGAGVLLGMLVLAGIGAYATAQGLAGHAVESAVASSVPRENSDLVAPVRSASTPRRAAVLPASGGKTHSAASREPEAKAPSPAMTEDGKVILNRAEPEDLMRLPGIGRKRAESIVELRAKLGGRFKRFTDLLRIRGIGPRRLKQMIPLMILDPPAAAEPSREEGNRG